ncbi:hypothetical protein Mgra_00004675 [Meloidogyne graminicola]|uniref:Nuclear receptor domain-containing protein n=1 Tax=Meloidogyne graminicola TaxID=189291 RepID=A0A8S9ZR61_9BILA|nr:hypothetical protein Mgra_00004675 [Meloidogyne graminicola]
MKVTCGPTLPELQCAICGQNSHGCHFGVVACRPCAAFFRRCIIENRNYKCLRGTNNCDIREGHRNACKACRLRLCRQSGMNYNFSASEDNDKKFLTKNDLQGQKLYSPDLFDTSEKIFEGNYAPNLAKITQAYDVFISGQRSLLEAASASIEEFIQIQSDSKPLYYTMLDTGFHLFSQIEDKTKLMIIDCSFEQFFLLHSCYLTISQFPDVDDTRYVANFGYAIDINELDHFVSRIAKEKSNPEEYIRIKKPLMEKFYKFISSLKRFPEGIKQQDICAMMAVSILSIAQRKFGQSTVNNVLPDLVQCKDTILSEWLADFNTRFGNDKNEEPAILMAHLLCKLVELNV